jgi:hypothetical protein
VVGTFSFDITGQDVSSFLVYTKNYSLTISPPLSITTSSTVPPVTVGGTYRLTTLEAASVDGSLTWFSSVSAPGGAGNFRKAFTRRLRKGSRRE